MRLKVALVIPREIGLKGRSEMSAQVFLSHSTADKPAAENLARRLAEEGIEAWLDKWNLIPGASWQPAIEDALKECESCAVFVGPEGLGPWQTEEMRLAINRRVCDSAQRFRVIPVLLPGAKRESLPELLVNTTWPPPTAFTGRGPPPIHQGTHVTRTL
jgi:hypothetical protein